MAESDGIAPTNGYRGADAHNARPEFVEFRNRIRRLVESLVGLRDVPPAHHSFGGQERVEVKLESDAVIVQFFVSQLPWKAATSLVNAFRATFANLSPLFLNSFGGYSLKISKSREIGPFVSLGKNL